MVLTRLTYIESTEPLFNINYELKFIVIYTKKRKGQKE